MDNWLPALGIPSVGGSTREALCLPPRLQFRRVGLPDVYNQW